MTPPADQSNNPDLDALLNLDVDDAKARDVPQSAKAQALANEVRKPHPSPDPPAAVLNGSINSPAFLTGLVKWHPAVGSFQYLADCCAPATLAPDQRFNQLATARPRFLAFCIFIDFVLMLIVLVGLSVIASRIIWMTLFA